MLLVLLPVAGLIVAFGVWERGGPLTQVAKAEGPIVPLFTVPELEVASGSAVPTTPPDVPADPSARTTWITTLAAHTDLPRRALQAYVTAATLTAQRSPGCHMTWTMLAGIGRIESDHGQHQGDWINPNGTEGFPIIGPALDGSPGVQKIADTDHGRLDGDTTWDHAVGPMQFLPSRWMELGQRASGDGQPPDPQNIDDATLTAAGYLCRSGDLSQPANWWAAAFQYNNSVPYGRAVFSAADAYAKAALVKR